MNVNYYTNQPYNMSNIIVIVNFKKTKQGWKKTVDVCGWTVDGRYTELYMKFNKGTAIAKSVKAIADAVTLEDCHDISERNNGSWLNWESGYIALPISR
jgi:hypothetical protein